MNDLIFSFWSFSSAIPLFNISSVRRELFSLLVYKRTTMPGKRNQMNCDAFALRNARIKWCLARGILNTFCGCLFVCCSLLLTIIRWIHTCLHLIDSIAILKNELIPSTCRCIDKDRTDEWIVANVFIEKLKYTKWIIPTHSGTVGFCFGLCYNWWTFAFHSHFHSFYSWLCYQTKFQWDKKWNVRFQSTSDEHSALFSSFARTWTCVARVLLVLPFEIRLQIVRFSRRIVS